MRAARPPRAARTPRAGTGRAGGPPPRAGRGMKTFAFVLPSLAGGGAEKSTLILSRTLNRLGHAAHVLVLDRRSDYDIAGEANVHFLPGNTGRRRVAPAARAARLADLARAIETRDSTRFDLVVAVNADAWEAVARCPFPRVFYSVRNSIEGWLALMRRRGLLRYLRERRRVRVLDGRHLLTVSRGLQHEVETSGRVRPASVTTIYSPFDLESIRRLAAEDVPGIPAGRFILHAGRVARQKRHDILFAAMRLVPADVALVLLTRDAHLLRPKIAAAGLVNRVVMPGFQQNPYPWMRRAALTVLSSDFEGFARVLVESLACGTPVVSTDCPHGPSEILTGDLARWLVPPGNADALGRRIAEALAARIDVPQPAILAEVEADTAARRYLDL
jgi:glycosyltransferase involved in cell wall biosynthesis